MPINRSASGRSVIYPASSVAYMQTETENRFATTATSWRVSSDGSLLIRGGFPLTGLYPISGAKNAVLPLIVAALLTRDPVALRYVPDTLDVAVLATLCSASVWRCTDHLASRACLS